MSNTASRVFIVADDLTGAADTANYYRTERRQVRIGFDDFAPWDFSLNERIIQVYDSESRALAPDGAYQKVFHAMDQLHSALPEGAKVYKKVDSTLRGNIASEILACLIGLEKRVALLAPAFPANGRTVVQGRLLIDGIPVHETSFSRDPHHPILASEVSEHLSNTFPLHIHALPLATIRCGVHAVRERIRQAQGDREVFVADAETDADLLILALAVHELDEVLPCGSAGLAKALAQPWFNEASQDSSHFTAKSVTLPRDFMHSPSLLPCDRVLVVVGSAHPQSHFQFHHLMAQEQTHSVTFSPVRFANSLQKRRELDKISQELTHAREPIVGIAVENERIASAQAINLEADLGFLVARQLEFWHQQQPNQRIGLIVTGGDTALAVCRAIGAAAIWPEGEILPGIPWSRIEIGDQKLVLVSKAGGFGAADDFATIVDWLRADALQGLEPGRIGTNVPKNH